MGKISKMEVQENPVFFRGAGLIQTAPAAGKGARLMVSEVALNTRRTSWGGGCYAYGDEAVK